MDDILRFINKLRIHPNYRIRPHMVIAPLLPPHSPPPLPRLHLPQPPPLPHPLHRRCLRRHPLLVSLAVVELVVLRLAVAVVRVQDGSSRSWFVADFGRETGWPVSLRGVGRYVVRCCSVLALGTPVSNSCSFYSIVFLLTSSKMSPTQMAHIV